mmetsp:Transcript_51737/g.172663  ORF Transcript_51737/g.172663 Transcript_51737/m.172663 type:complete len:270 (-) Transcript_51737:1239-2048(-)
MYFLNLASIAFLSAYFCESMTERSSTEMARLTSSLLTALRRCMRADASAIRMMDSMCRTAIVSPPPAASRRSSVYTCVILPWSMSCSTGRTFWRAYMMYLRSSVWSMASLAAAACIAPAVPSSSARGWSRRCDPTTNSARRSSSMGSTVSLTTQMQSKRERIGSVRSTFSVKESDGSYVPLSGFAAAMTAQRACSVAMMPALEMEMDCCSIASWIEVRSASFILSNSSIRQTPLSASTSAPPSRVHSRVTGSLCTEAVRPTAVAPWPVV